MDLARAGGEGCSLPPIVTAEGDNHYHPVVMIMVYKRNPDASNPVHDIVRVITPGRGLGIKTSRGSIGVSTADSTYRTIHAHGDTGELHVEPLSGKVERVCDLIRLWSSVPEISGNLGVLEGTTSAHVRIGERYVRNLPLENVLRIPLDHNMPITIFVEAQSPL